MDRMFVKPKKNTSVADPVTGNPLPEKGAWVPMESYWFRRLKEGVVVREDPPKQVPEKKGE